MALRTSQTLYSIGPVTGGGSTDSTAVDTNLVPADVAAQAGWNTVDDALEGLNTTQQSLLAQDTAFMASLTAMQASLTTLNDDLGDVANTQPLQIYDGA